MSEWKEYGLNEIASFSQGKQIPVSDQFENNLEGLDRFIRIVDFTSDWTQPARYVKKDDKYKVGRNDIVMLRYGTPGKVFRGHEGIIANNMFKIAPDESIVTKEYLYWFLYQDSVYKILMANQSSSTMPAISFKMLSCVNVRVPSFDMQEQISSFFDYIDDKIAVNRRICENLEAQAQALFKHWFIDFAPFKNGKFVESELGMIPEGWRVGKFTDIFDLGSGGTPKTSEKLYWEDGSIPFFSPKDVNGVYCFDTEKHITEKGLNNCSSSLYSKNTIFITCRGTVGKIAMAAVPMAMNQSNYAILSNKGYSQYFAYLMTVSIVKKLKFKANGAVFDAITSKDFKEQIIIPNLNVVNRFDSIIQPIFDNILNIGFENLRLSTLRDALLPKLMSGQIKV